MFWVAFIFPGLATTIGWMMLMDPDVGILNTLIAKLPFIDEGPFNIFGLAGIVWANLKGNGIAYKVILLTPAFRNMDVALEEAARVSGAFKVSALVRVTLPVMISPIILVFALQVLRVFSGFETEQLLGARVGFYVFSTLIFRQTTSQVPPDYAAAIVLATITLVLIGFIFPLRAKDSREPQQATGGQATAGIQGLTHRASLTDSHTRRMVFHMKTTLNIDDTVMKRLRAEAARRSTTISALVEAGLRRILDDPPAEEDRQFVLPPLPILKGGSFLVDVANRDELYRVMEEEE